MARGASVFVDGFRGFTQQELAVLALVMRRAKSVTVTLCTDRVHDDTDGLDRFSIVMKTARRLSWKRVTAPFAIPMTAAVV